MDKTTWIGYIRHHHRQPELPQLSEQIIANFGTQPGDCIINMSTQQRVNHNTADWP